MLHSENLKTIKINQVRLQLMYVKYFLHGEQSLDPFHQEKIQLIF